MTNRPSAGVRQTLPVLTPGLGIGTTATMGWWVRAARGAVGPQTPDQAWTPSFHVQDLRLNRPPALAAGSPESDPAKTRDWAKTVLQLSLGSHSFVFLAQSVWSPEGAGVPPGCSACEVKQAPPQRVREPVSASSTPHATASVGAPPGTRSAGAPASGGPELGSQLPAWLSATRGVTGQLRGQGQLRNVS